ncbi:Sec-independent protein translocase protein TatB [Azospirillum soli]|uniref:Sec-independent protein translocase protein TatB n=1 Tax=Azospirillum soli TaxID=1304799 RepID=UPI001AE9E21F|nr:Sec-independent protein translocase protein TatB [Azospirillum soli]MBP2316033.1 sec-independent protein translocase protein TatB [Azospirillum soli]
MFDIAWSELMVIAVVALVVIGPKDLPKTIYTLGKWVRKARLVARDFQGHLDDMMREAELDELRKEALKVRDANLQKMVEDTVDPKGDLKAAFDIGGANGYPGSPSEEASAPSRPQPQTATEPPVTAPAPPAPPVEFNPSPASAIPAATAPAAEPVAVQTTNKQT